MPDKGHFRRRYSNECIICWHNKLKQANKLKKEQLSKQNRWYTEESDTDLEQEELITYNNNLEEFFTKYIVSNHTEIQMSDLIRQESFYKDWEYNDDIEQYTYDRYNEWLSSEKKNINRLTLSKFKKNLLKTFNDNDKLLFQDNGFYAYKCTYGENQ